MRRGTSDLALCQGSTASFERGDHRALRRHAHARARERAARVLVERGARLDLKDILWRGTAADWANHAGKTEIEDYLRRKMSSEKQE